MNKTEQYLSFVGLPKKRNLKNNKNENERNLQFCSWNFHIFSINHFRNFIITYTSGNELKTNGPMFSNYVWSEIHINFIINVRKKLLL